MEGKSVISFEEVVTWTILLESYDMISHKLTNESGWGFGRTECWTSDGIMFGERVCKLKKPMFLGHFFYVFTTVNHYRSVFLIAINHSDVFISIKVLQYVVQYFALLSKTCYISLFIWHILNWVKCSVMFNIINAILFIQRYIN